MKHLLIVTAAIESATGVALLVAPSLVAYLLLGTGFTSPEAMVVGRIGGAALLVFSVSCWLARNRSPQTSASDVVACALMYNAIVAGLLVYAATANMVGMLMWPAIMFHSSMFVWCAARLQTGHARREATQRG